MMDALLLKVIKLLLEGLSCAACSQQGYDMFSCKYTVIPFVSFLQCSCSLAEVYVVNPSLLRSHCLPSDTQSSISGVLTDEVWTPTEVDVAHYGGNSRWACSVHGYIDTLTPGCAFINPHPCCVFPKATRPTYPDASHPYWSQLAMPWTNNNLFFFVFFFFFF